MRFSGHETFPIREGWLHKGLRLLIEEPDKFFSKQVADYLGVGSNMAKSIRHWLLATKLAKSDLKERGRILPSEFGKVVFEKDPFFIETGTWWMLHVNLVGPKPYATTWYWFFNFFNLERFDRAILAENLRQYTHLRNSRTSSIRTLERDVACLLSSYSRHIPAENIDPEEARECPFRELGLTSYFRSSGYYQQHYRAKEIHPSVFGYCVAKAFEDAGEGDIDIHRLLRDPSGPGRAFSLTSESLHETLVQIINKYDDIRIRGYAGQRAVSIPRHNSLYWVKEYYNTQKEND